MPSGIRFLEVIPLIKHNNVTILGGVIPSVSNRTRVFIVSRERFNCLATLSHLLVLLIFLLVYIMIWYILVSVKVVHINYFLQQSKIIQIKQFP